MLDDLLNLFCAFKVEWGEGITPVRPTYVARLLKRLVPFAVGYATGTSDVCGSEVDLIKKIFFFGNKVIKFYLM
jgi:hypothetical protein